MSINTRLHVLQDQTLIDMYVPAKAGTQWFARAVWPDDVAARPAVISELLRHIGKAVVAGDISVEAFHVPTT